MTNIFSVFSQSETTVDLIQISYGPHLMRVPDRWHTCHANSRAVI